MWLLVSIESLSQVVPNRPLCYSLFVPAPAISRSDRLAALKPTAVNAILAEMRAFQAQGGDLVSLMRGEPDLPTPPHIVEACTRALRNGRTGYPDNRGEKTFREAVARKLQRDNQLNFDPATEVLATSGSTFGIYAALTAVLNEGDEVLLPDPVYDAYQSPIRLAGGRVKPVTARIEDGTICHRGRGSGSRLVASGASSDSEHAMEPGGHGADARRADRDRTILRTA